MPAELHKGDQLTDTYTNSSGTLLANTVQSVATGVDVVVVNTASDDVGQNTSRAYPSGTAVYTVDKDTDFATTAGSFYDYDSTTDNELSGATAAGSVSSWMAVESVLASATKVKCLHVLHSVPA